MFGLKKKVNNILATISYEQASEVIKGNSIAELINGAPEAKFSMGLKKFIALLCAVCMPIFNISAYLMGNVETTILSLTIAYSVMFLFIAVACYLFVKRTSIFENARYQLFINYSARIFLLSYLGGAIGDTEDNYLFVLLTHVFLFVLILSVQLLAEKNLLISSINDMFQTEFPTNKMVMLLIKAAGICLVVGLVVMQLYRLNKFWLIRTGMPTLDFGTVINNVLGIMMLMVIAVIPTFLCFDAKVYVKAKLVEQYSEQFRTKYQYPKEIWYGE